MASARFFNNCCTSVRLIDYRHFRLAIETCFPRVTATLSSGSRGNCLSPRGGDNYFAFPRLCFLAEASLRSGRGNLLEEFALSLFAASVHRGISLCVWQTTFTFAVCIRRHLASVRRRLAFLGMSSPPLTLPLSSQRGTHCPIVRLPPRKVVNEIFSLRHRKVECPKDNKRLDSVL